MQDLREHDDMYMRWLLSMYGATGQSKWLDLMEVHCQFLKKLAAEKGDGGAGSEPDGVSNKHITEKNKVSR